MTTRKFALGAGLVYVMLGIAALVPQLSTHSVTLPPMRLDESYGLFVGIFPMNIVNKLALLAFGVAGILVARASEHSERNAKRWARTVAFTMGAAALLGVFPPTQTFFGLWPLWGPEAALHAVNALVAAVFGFNLLGRLPGPPRLRTPVHH